MFPKIRSRRSDGPISKFRICGENVGRSFVVCSHDPIFKTNKESSIWRRNDHRIRFSELTKNLQFGPKTVTERSHHAKTLTITKRSHHAKFVGTMKIKHVLFPSVFQNYGSMCQKVIFNVFRRSDFRNQQKSNPQKRIV